jgi:hypothetical protein
VSGCIYIKSDTNQSSLWQRLPHRIENFLKDAFTTNRWQKISGPRPCHKDTQREYRYSPTHSLIMTLHGGEWSTSRAGHFTPSAPKEQVTGWTPKQVRIFLRRKEPLAPCQDHAVHSLVKIIYSNFFRYKCQFPPPKRCCCCFCDTLSIKPKNAPPIVKQITASVKKFQM